MFTSFILLMKKKNKMRKGAGASQTFALELIQRLSSRLKRSHIQTRCCQKDCYCNHKIRSHFDVFLQFFTVLLLLLFVFFFAQFCFYCHAITNESASQPIQKVQNLGTIRKQIYEKPRQEPGLCDNSYARYSERRFSQI